MRILRTQCLIHASGTTGIFTRLSERHAMSIKYYESNISRSRWRMSVWCYVPYNKTRQLMQKNIFAVMPYTYAYAFYLFTYLNKNMWKKFNFRRRYFSKKFYWNVPGSFYDGFRIFFKMYSKIEIYFVYLTMYLNNKWFNHH